MGPERKAPENFDAGFSRRYRTERFNGAGAKGSGKQWFRRGGEYDRTCFNGAGAKGSGKLSIELGSMLLDALLQWGRSERLRKTWPLRSPTSQPPGFNGAGAKGSGKRGKVHVGEVKYFSFNGAGAKGSGKRKRLAIPYLRSRRASMGPERKAPENGQVIVRRIVEPKLQWGRSERLRKTKTKTVRISPN